VCPTFSVPGINSSGIIFRNLKIDAVGAKDPMPRVSKKLVTNPMKSSKAEGMPGAQFLPRNQVTMYSTPKRPRAINNQPRAFSIGATIAKKDG